MKPWTVITLDTSDLPKKVVGQARLKQQVEIYVE
jgi:hypothetical protein